MERYQDGVHSLEDDYQGAHSLGEAQGEVHTATEQAAAHSMEEGACKGVNSLEEGQGDVQMEAASSPQPGGWSQRSVRMS